MSRHFSIFIYLFLAYYLLIKYRAKPGI